MKDEHQEESAPIEKSQPGRRDFLKSLVTVPVLGAMAYGVYKKAQNSKLQRDVRDVFHLDGDSLEIMDMQPDGKRLRIGIVGVGIRGRLILRDCGFAEPEHIDRLKAGALKNPKDTRYTDYCQQESLNIEIAGVCDIFDVRAAEALKMGANINKEGCDGQLGTSPKRYSTYQEMMADPTIDAVIIATPDHWHGTMAIEAARYGKHIYLEKPMTWTVPETYAVRESVRKSGVVFQLGHQNRQTDSYIRAKEIVRKGLLGQISLIEVCTNRNDPNGAWVYNIHKEANSGNIDWSQFVPDAKRQEEYFSYMKSKGLERFMVENGYQNFNLEHFFRWRCWWEYSTGLSGDLLTHEYDAVNQIMEIGIPASATSSGGVYFFKDGRTVPDVLQTTFEFPKKNLTMLYSATQASSRPRSKVIMGHDASLELGSTLTMKVDANSTRYREKIKKGIIRPNEPFYNYIPGSDDVDAITSATELYFAQRGLLYTYAGGKRYNATYLHVREWLECIRQGKTPSCNIDRAFEEAMTAHMGTRAYLEGRTTYWDEEKEEIV